MASDRQVLAAISMKTGGDCRYFELVQLTCGDLRRKCFVCVGKHSLFFLRQDLNGPLHDGADVYYSSIAAIVQDESSDQHCLLTLAEELPGWQSDRLFIKAEHRSLFLRHLRCNWQTDHMWRLGRVVVFPLSIHPITKQSSFDNYVLPYKGYRWTKFQGYRFMVPDRFDDQASGHNTEAGEYVDEDGVSIVIDVHAEFSLEQLNRINRGNIRWVAGEYKTQLCSAEKQFYVIRNALRDKRMNLAADLAQWHQWELIIRTRSATILCLVMRRQYIPPTCSSAQDMAVILRCPEEQWQQKETALLLEAYLIADSICTDSPNVSVYRDVVQAKLDSLRLDEDGVEWVSTHLKLKTIWEVEAARFVKSVWKLFCDDKVEGYDPAILELSAIEIFEDASPEDQWAELECIDNFQEYFQEMMARGEGLPLSGSQSEALDEDSKLRIQHHWHARVARYFAWAIDGGLLGARLNLELMIEGLSALTEESYKKAYAAFQFLLHLRPLDMTKPFHEVSLTQQMKDKNLSQWSFNDRVMLAILSTDFLKKQIGKGRDADFFRCLANLLEAGCGANLKAYICRIFMEMKAATDTKAKDEDPAANLIVVPAMLSLLNSGGVFLAVYASAALVNLSSGNQAVKMVLMGQGMAKTAVRNLQAKDDDLGYYTMMLLVNLTKEPHNRSVIASAGLIPLLYDILTSSYSQVRPSAKKGQGIQSAALGSIAKERLLTQTCIVIGQFCNDDRFREQFIDIYPHTVKCLLYIFTTVEFGTILSSKTIFALKQLCASRNDQKHHVGTLAIPHLIECLGDEDVEKPKECIYQSLLLLNMLSGLSTNSELMYKVGLIPALEKLSVHPAAKRSEGFQARYWQLMQSMSAISAAE
eukprot:CAMPEP_0181489434 /NCGR_PEP_ID=MMETSP1110-20121109/48984_1 /TAXON_ID=174948 /ORGANISM="Symbiodinium sp., Strain CCMP421" /LENGTH=868 /DNA_ID=CAMNT_0023616275 /DNA_START=26 /DNA_END=2629 /DNA_ORIENTATION=-